jgi:hypothetical protein
MSVEQRVTGPGTECAFEGCLREVWAKGWCFAHYQQGVRGTEKGPVRPRNKVEWLDATTKICTRCGAAKDLSEYHTNKQTGYVVARCKACVKALRKPRTAVSA